MSDSEYIQQLESALESAISALVEVEFSSFGGLDGPGYCGNCGWRDPHHAVDCVVHSAIVDGNKLLANRRAGGDHV